MFTLKPLHPNAIPKALEKAERYRLLNEPEEAESICLDILQIEPHHTQALITLLLALTDQFRSRLSECFSHAQNLVSQLPGEYERCYYSGIICERRGNAHLDHGGPGSRPNAFDWFQQAMHWYEKAEKLRPPDVDDPILRWNTCARTIMKHRLHPPSAEITEPLLQE